MPAALERTHGAAAAMRWLMGRLAALCGRAMTTPVLPAVLALACLAAYAGQLGLGRWSSDEFTLFFNQRNWGWRVLPQRLAYAPRPFSEGLLFLYGEAVLRLGRPLVVTFLGVLWAGAFGAGLLAAASVLPRSRRRWMTAVALVGALFAFVLATSRVTEVFYWPVAAVAYLPVTGAGVVLLFLLSGRPGRRIGCGLALGMAAASSEMGAAMAIGFAGAAMVEAATRAGSRSWWVGLREGAWWIVPGLIGLAAMAVLVSQRVDLVELGADTQPYTGNAVAAIGMAARQLALDALGSDGADWDPWAMLGALGARLVFALGFVLVWRQADPVGAAPGRGHAVLAVSFGGAAFFSVAAAYYHYGALCCERQSVTRHWLIDMLAILAMGWALQRWPGKGWGRRAWAPALLALSLSPVLFRVDGLRLGYDHQRLAIDARARTWRSGQQQGTDRMEFYLPPDMDGMLVRGTSLPISNFRIGPGTPDLPIPYMAIPEWPLPNLVPEVGRFFGKSIVTVCQPWQTEKSWLIRGQFIPACPAHDGPPEVVLP